VQRKAQVLQETVRETTFGVVHANGLGHVIYAFHHQIARTWEAQNGSVVVVAGNFESRIAAAIRTFGLDLCLFQTKRKLNFDFAA